MFISAWAAAVFAIVVWGVTFAATRSLLEEFSALEILVLILGGREGRGTLSILRNMAHHRT